MNFVEASESAFSISAGMLRASGRGSLEETSVKGYHSLRSAEVFICYSAQDGVEDTDLDPSEGMFKADVTCTLYISLHVEASQPHPAHTHATMLLLKRQTNRKFEF